MKIIPASHLDHGLLDEHVAFVLERFASRREFFVETVKMPITLEPLWCTLYGPLVGDEPVPESEVIYVTRGARTWASRSVRRGARASQLLTVIGGPLDAVLASDNGVEPGEIVLFTAFGGPASPREPGDPSVPESELEASVLFWAQHALTTSGGG